MSGPELLEVPTTTSRPGTPSSPRKVASAQSLTATVVDGQRRLPGLLKYTLLSIFSLSQFLDSFNNSAVLMAIPVLQDIMGITSDEVPWCISAFQLTFASFLLVSGKISDVYNPKYTFIAGIGGLGVLCLGTGFVNNKILFFVLRAIGGICGSLTIPSSLKLLVQIFPEPKEQARAIGIFGGLAAFGNISGLVIGALFVQYTNWRWILWFAAIACISMAAISTILIPKQTMDPVISGGASKLRRLDLPGVSALTIACVLFIYALTTASSAGWGSAGVLAPLIISVALVVGFFFWEARLPLDCAAIPSEMWFYPNFSVLFAVALFPFFWWINVYTIYDTLWQEAYHWSVISTVVHMLPIPLASFAMGFTGSLTRSMNSKLVIIIGQIMLVASNVLLAFADRESRYWSFAVPAFIVGSAGAMLVYIQTNIAIFRSAPSSMAGTVGAIFNGALQIGSAVGLAAVGSIQNGINSEDTGSYAGRRAAFWFVLAITGVEIIAILIFMKAVPERNPRDEKVGGGDSSGSDSGDEGSSVKVREEPRAVEEVGKEVPAVRVTNVSEKSEGEQV